MNKKKVIVFDFDGVIADTKNLSYSIFKSIFPSATMKDLEDESRGNVYESPIFKWTDEQSAFYDNEQKKLLDISLVFPVKELLELLARNHPLVIISSSLENNIFEFLDDVGFNCHFERVYGKRASLSKIKKFNMLFEDFEVKPEECLFVTDTLGDLNEAEAVNVESIAVTWGYHDRKTLQEGKSIAIVDSVEELQHHIP